MLSCFKLSVFVFIMGVNGENKAWHELNHKIWVKPCDHPPPCNLSVTRRICKEGVPCVVIFSQISSAHLDFNCWLMCGYLVCFLLSYLANQHPMSKLATKVVAHPRNICHLSVPQYWSYVQIAGCQPTRLLKLDMLGFGCSRMLRMNSKFWMYTNFRMKLNFRIRLTFSMKANLRIRFDFSMKPNFRIRFDFRVKPNFRIRFDFSIKLNFRIRFDFSMKPALEKRLSIQLYSRQWAEEVSGQVYHQHTMLHIVNLMASVNNWCSLSIFHVKLMESNRIFA